MGQGPLSYKSHGAYFTLSWYGMRQIAAWNSSREFLMLKALLHVSATGGFS